MLIDGKKHVTWLSATTFETQEPPLSTFCAKHVTTSPIIALVHVDGEEAIAAHCHKCKDIRLVRLPSAESTVVYFSRIPVVAMCGGEAGALWLLHIDGGAKLVQVTWSDTVFKKSGKRFGVELPGHWRPTMLYLPAPRKTLVVCDPQSGGRVVAFSGRTGEPLWEVTPDAHAHDFEIGRLAFSVAHQVVLVAHRKNEGVVALSPRDGSLVTLLPLPLVELGEPHLIGCSGNHVILLSGKNREEGRGYDSVLSLNKLSRASTAE